MKSPLARLIGQLATGCAVLLVGTATLQAATVESMRLWAAPDHARLVFDLTAAAEANVFSLENPSRLVIDLDESQLNTDINTAARWQCDCGSANRRADGGLRVVLELNRDIEPRHFTLRLMISMATVLWWIWSTRRKRCGEPYRPY